MWFFVQINEILSIVVIITNNIIINNNTTGTTAGGTSALTATKQRTTDATRTHTGIYTLMWFVIQTNTLGRHSIYTLVLSRLIFLGISYSVISSNRFCGHAEGGTPAYCYRAGSEAASECKDTCTSFTWCIAYSADSSSCYLMPSIGSCPNGWLYNSGKIATHRGDLIPGSYSGYNCMAKGIA